MSLGLDSFLRLLNVSPLAISITAGPVDHVFTVATVLSTGFMIEGLLAGTAYCFPVGLGCEGTCFHDSASQIGLSSLCSLMFSICKVLSSVLPVAT